MGPLGLRVNQASPWVDARLPGGNRVQIKVGFTKGAEIWTVGSVHQDLGHTHRTTHMLGLVPILFRPHLHPWA